MKFKHHATDEIIEVEPSESEKQEIVFCKKLNKYFCVIRKRGNKTYLKKTSYVEYTEKWN